MVRTRRPQGVEGKTADEEGLQLAVDAPSTTRRRRARRGADGAAAAGGVEVSSHHSSCYRRARPWLRRGSVGGPPQENEFGFRKQWRGDRRSCAAACHRAIGYIDELLAEEGLEVQTLDSPDAAAKARLQAGEEDAIGVVDEQGKKRRIHPRDLARFLVSCLDPAALNGGSDDASSAERSRIVEIWTHTVD